MTRQLGEKKKATATRVVLTSRIADLSWMAWDQPSTQTELVLGTDEHAELGGDRQWFYVCRALLNRNRWPSREGRVLMDWTKANVSVEGRNIKVHWREDQVPTRERQGVVLIEARESKKATTARSIDWNRWHELLEKRESESLTAEDNDEYVRLRRLVEKGDIDEAEEAREHLERSVLRHAQVLQGLEDLAEAIRAAASK